MRKITLALAVATLALGCSHSVPQAGANLPTPAAPAAPPQAAARPTVERAEEPLKEEASVQKPGDYVTYRFSGSFRKAPLTLTQRVVDVQGTTVIVDITLKDGPKSQRLRAHFANGSSPSSELIRVSRMEGSSEFPATSEAYDALMAQTVLAADRNEEVLGTEKVDLTIAGRSIPCTKTSYRVVVGKAKATMSTLTSDSFAWGDLGGEILRDDGKILYRAEVTDVGSDAPQTDRVARVE